MSDTSYDLPTVRRLLEEELQRSDEISSELGAARAPADNWTGTLSRPGDMADAAGLRAAQTDADTIVHAARRRRDQILAALERMDAGTYGVCDVCGGPIGRERLEVLPYTSVCVDDVRSLRRPA